MVSSLWDDGLQKADPCPPSGDRTTFLLRQVNHHVSSVVFEREHLSEADSSNPAADKRPAAELTFLQFTPVTSD